MSTSIYPSSEFASHLQEAVSGFCSLAAEQLKILEGHYSSLVRWNSIINLTRVTEVGEAVMRHYAESLFLASVIGGGSVIDVGSGAGFPGFPLAVFRPEAAVTLCESHQRKAVFLREISRGVRNVCVVARRGEDVADRFDWVISRAVLAEDVLSFGLADRFGLLMSHSDAARLESVSHVAASQRIPLPWDESRLVLLGESVSRGTA